MKISKVEHIRAAVSRQNYNETSEEMKREIGGVLYHNPAKNGKIQADLKEHINALNGKVQGIYNVFNTNVECEDTITKDMLYNFNYITKWLLKKTYQVSEEEAICRQQKSLDNFVTYCIPAGKDKSTKKIIQKTGAEFEIPLSKEFSKQDLFQMVKRILADHLRNSLRVYATCENTKKRVYIPDVLERLMYASCLGKGYSDEYRAISQNDIVLMLKIMNADYTKKAQIEQMAKSIENQNVKVQPNKDGILQLSSAVHVNKKDNYKSKKYIFDFVKEYVCLDKKQREKKLQHIRRLIVLYFYGVEAYQDKSVNITPWSFGLLENTEERYFSKKAKSLMDTKEDWSEEERKNKNNEIRELVRNEICVRFRRLFKEKVVPLEDSDYFWLNWIIREVENIFYRKPYIKERHIELFYLCKRIWNNWTAFISMKYVDMGKAVYHFTIPALDNMKNGQEVIIGELLPEFREGLTSFDYERIKAEETLHRGLSTYITFAVNTFAQAITSEKTRSVAQFEDILFKSEILEETYEDSDRRILQYFGGKSRWKDTLVADLDCDLMIKAILASMRLIRNASFHYTADSKLETYEQQSILHEMYDKEVKELGAMYCEKYYSVNVLMFYSMEDIGNLMKKLYQEQQVMAQKVPAFKHILSRNDMEKTAKWLIGDSYYNLNLSFVDSGILRKLEAVQYFVLQEIYYHDFIGASDCRKMFLDEKDKLNENDKEHGKAAKNFKKRVETILKSDSQCSLETLCEILMTDYNMQNTGKERLASCDVKTDKDKTIYKHFPLLLRQCMGQAFLKYVKNSKEYSFLGKPVVWENSGQSEEIKREFFEQNKELKVSLYLDEQLKKDDRIMAWYAMAHFLSPKYLNQLNGEILSYIQMVENINKRAKITGNRIVEYSEKIGYYRKVITVLSLIRNYAGRVSHDITDYFEGNTEQAYEEYAKYLFQYVEFADLQNYGEYLYAEALRTFADQKIEKGSPSGKIGIYYDGKNPIINRNIILTMLYGNIKSIRESIQKVERKDIQSYYQMQDKVSEVLTNGFCLNEKQLTDYKQYQNQKNRVELLDIRIFAEIINDLNAKLISWSYLRERDLMYFHLGVHYLRQHYKKDIFGDDFRRKIIGENVHICDGGILYQIIAMNTYELPLFVHSQEDNQVVASKEKGSGLSIKNFTKEYPNEYEVALELFENVEEHEDIIHTRDYFDHFKYYARADQSIMDMFSEVYDRFFIYDPKLKKSVSYILADILKSYFVIADISMGSYGEISYQRGKNKKQYVRKNGQIVLRGELKSDQFTYKIKEKNNPKMDSKRDYEGNKGKRRFTKTSKVDARTESFLKQLRGILEYSTKKR